MSIYYYKFLISLNRQPYFLRSRIGSVIFRYQRNGRTEKRDDEWRLKCSRCRLMDPVSSYGVAPEFLKNVESPGSSRSSGDLLLKASRRRSSSSGKRRRRSDSGRSNPSPTLNYGIVSEEPIDISDSPHDVKKEKGPCTDSTSVSENGVLAPIAENKSVESELCANGPRKFVGEECGVEIDDDEVNDLVNGPSFLKRVSAPLGEDLLILLNTPAKNIPGQLSATEQSQNNDVVKSLFSPGPGTNNDDMNLSGPGTNVSENSSAVAGSSPALQNSRIAALSKTDFPPPENTFKLLKKSMSMDSNAGVVGKERSGSFVPSVSMRCAGCDACRGRVCRPRLAGDFVTVMTPVRYVPTAYPLTQGKPVAVGLSPLSATPLSPLSVPPALIRRASSGSIDGMHPAISGEKNKSVFWDEKIKYAIPFRRTIRLLTMISSSVCPRVIFLQCMV